MLRAMIAWILACTPPTTPPTVADLPSPPEDTAVEPGWYSLDPVPVALQEVSVLALGDEVSALGASGAVLEVPVPDSAEPNPPEPPLHPLPLRELQARAAEEAYVAARDAGQTDRARNLARFIERLDAERGAPLVAEVGDASFEDPEGRAGVAAGALFRN